MKRLIILFVVALIGTTTVFAQKTETQTKKKNSTLTTFEKGRNTIGLRIGNDMEISYQKYLGKVNRLEVDLGYNFNYGVNIAGTYQWLWALDIDGLGFNWYAGVGANLGIWDSKFGLGALGQIGIEYNFNIPLALSLDWRPGIHFIPDMHIGWQGFALGVRYRF